jgi:uncharacterized protein DUF4239
MRWLLNNVPTPLIGMVVVGTVVGLSLLASNWVRKHDVDSIDTEGAMDPLGTVGVAYGLILALVIFGLWTNFQAARDTVSNEAGALAQVALDIRALPPADEARIEHRISGYIAAVVNVEWQEMKVGRESPRAHAALDKIALALESAQPTTPTAQVFYQEAVTKLNDVATARRQRIEAVEREIPAVFRVLLFAGAAVPIGFVVLISKRRMHAFLVGGIAALFAYTLFLAIVLDYPFSGTVSVSTAPYHSGFLAHLAP